MAGCDIVDFFRNRARMYRYRAMILLCLLGLGGFVCFDSVGSLQDVFMTHLDLSASDFSLTYSINSWPNIVLCFFGGYLIDRFFGIQRGAIIYSTLYCIGHMIFSLGTVLGLFWLILLGRFIFGIGLEVMFICLQCYSIVWFKGKELSLVISLMISISRLGTSISYEAATPLYLSLQDKVDGKQAVGIVFFIIGLVAFVSIACSVILKFMNPKKYSEDSDPSVTGMDKKEGSKPPTITWRDIINFPKTFWTIVVNYTVFASAIFVLIPFSQTFFMEVSGLTVEESNNVTSFFSILGAVIAPFCGIVVDRVGRTVFFLLLGMANLVLANLLLSFSSASPYAGMFFMSFGFALLTSSLSPMFSYIFPEHQLGTAFGVNMSIVNLFYATNLVIAGVLVDRYGFLAFEYYILSWSLVGFIATSFLWIQDKRGNGVLNMSRVQRIQYEEEQKKKDEAKEPLRNKS